MLAVLIGALSSGVLAQRVPGHSLSSRGDEEIID
jgi:hypothetical protein